MGVPSLEVICTQGFAKWISTCVLLTLTGTSGCAMCDHPYDWAGPVFVGAPQPNCPQPPRAGSILDPRSCTVSMPTRKRKKPSTPAAGEGKPASSSPSSASPDASPSPKAIPYPESTPPTQEPPLPGVSTATPRSLALQQPPADALEMDASGWRAKPAGWSTPAE
jgi:hypothetical protein